MDSPKREWTPSSELQGSPLFKFLCSLSPIKPARSVHVAQTYSELSFPPPPPVFASPKNQRFEKGNKSEDPGGRAFGEEENCWTSSAKYTLDSSICQVSGGHEVITRSLRPCEQTPPASHQRDEFVQITCASNKVCQNDTSQVVEDGENQAASENDFYFSNKLQLTELPNFPSEDGRFSEPSAISAESLCDFSKVESLDFHKAQHIPPCVTKLANDTMTEHIQDGEKSFKGNATNRGPRRRCLDFETNEFQGISSSPSMQDSASHPLGTGSTINSMENLDGVTTISTSTSASSKSEFVSEERGTLSGVTLHSNFQMTKLSESSRRLRNPGVSPTISSSIGLHLNSLSGTAGLTSNGKDCIPAYVPSRSGRSCEAQAGAEPNKGCANYGPGLLVSMVEKSQTDEELRGNPRIIKSTTRFRSVTLGIQSFEACLPCSVERSASPVGRKRLQLLQETSSQENSELQEKVRTPRKKRKSLSDGDGCKHCNCKKSKCLKLYCECFAAGVYCVDSCACHGCFNKPEYAETVLETRKQVESRNPLAFAPKIVQASESSPTNKDPCTDMSASARHKRGCNCKKSHCLKRYCECYQAGVGCSEGCRCNGCKNMFGKKKASEDAEEQESYADADPDTSELLPETNRILDGSQPHDTKSNQSVPRTVSPITPTPDHSLLASSASWSASNGDGRNESMRRTYVVQWVHSTNVDEKNEQELKPLDHKNVGVEQQSPQWNELSELCTITPAAQHPLRPPPSFSTTGKTCSLLLSNGDMEHLSTELKYGRMASPFDMSSVFDTKDSLATEHQSTSQGKSDAIGTASEDDSMPEMLREGQSTSNGSPKQKRVTPPRPDGLRRITSPVTRSSPRLLAGRKICLQALPSLPPVTPYGSVYGQGASGKQN